MRPGMRYAAAAMLVLGAIALRNVFDDWLPHGYPFMLSFGAVIASAALFRRGPGLFATGIAAVLSASVFYTPTEVVRVGTPGHLLSLAMFLTIAGSSTLMIGWMQEALDQLQVEKSRNILMLREFRHRSRNDLGSLVGMLLLRARGAESDGAREALREAASHALALARIHTRLSTAAPSGVHGAAVDVCDFVGGICEDLRETLFGNGLRPISLEVSAISAIISTERAVALGLVLNECVQNAAKYAFPDEGQGRIGITFACDGEHFVLRVEDDGIGIIEPMPCDPPRGGLGTRLLRALAAQLRGRFERHSRPDYPGTECILRFPISAPAPLHIAPH